MKLLLDTHSLLWFIGGDPALSLTARRLIEDDQNEKFVSTVSIWETAIKASLGKMSLTSPFSDLFPRQLDVNGFELLPVSVDHSSIVAVLPFHHRDPFDRMLAAQSIHEKMSLVSLDTAFDDYGVERFW
ncbi:MAG: type II toxin-antitoxin system VapC family toxin [Acidobacteria bacterium]|nr:type II toxin-antitoxin system VapC family toxin [Acidobacteriota bacterium]MBK8811986.1 type II toxin-antitoxin system VapC family toxin [Acidobacteriota bacterium]